MQQEKPAHNHNTKQIIFIVVQEWMSLLDKWQKPVELQERIKQMDMDVQSFFNPLEQEAKYEDI